MKENENEYLEIIGKDTTNKKVDYVLVKFKNEEYCKNNLEYDIAEVPKKEQMKDIVNIITELMFLKLHDEYDEIILKKQYS